MKEINFSKNWNNKLDCDFFMTIRIKNPEYYKVGDFYQITGPKKVSFKCLILSIKLINFSNINEYISYIDAGLNIGAYKELLRKFYKNADQLEYFLILLRKLKYQI